LVTREGLGYSMLHGETLSYSLLNKHYKKNCIYLQQKFACNGQNSYIIQNYLRIT